MRILNKWWKRNFLGILSDKIYVKKTSAIWLSYNEKLSQQNFMSSEQYILVESNLWISAQSLLFLDSEDRKEKLWIVEHVKEILAHRWIHK